LFGYPAAGRARKIALDRGRSDHISLTTILTLTYELDLQTAASYGYNLLT